MVLSGSNSSKSIDLMQRAMGAAVLRSQVLNNNISNATTPNYKRKDINFQSELEKALNSEKAQKIPVRTSSKNHIPIYRPKDYREVRPNIFTEYNTYQNNDGNSVDIEKEIIENTKNTMYFNALAQRTIKEFSKIKLLLK